MAEQPFKILHREPIECGLTGEWIEIIYGDAAVGHTRRIVFVDDLFESGDRIYVEGFCCLRAETRTFRLDRIHWISELPNGGYYQSFIAWLANYGVKIELVLIGSDVVCRWRR